MSVATGIAPIFAVRDLKQSIAFYEAAFGFETDATYGDGYAILSLGDVGLHLTVWREMDPRQNAGAAYLYVTDVDDLAVRAAAVKGGELRHDVELKPWGLREFAIVDPDGNLLRVGEFAGRAMA
jgi:catechol 2,3-dioxygenase-like lactoylglutathione lyase family enzyme